MDLVSQTIRVYFSFPQEAEEFFADLASISQAKESPILLEILDGQGSVAWEKQFCCRPVSCRTEFDYGKQDITPDCVLELSYR